MAADPVPETKTHSKDAVALGAVDFTRKATRTAPAAGTPELEELCGMAKPWLAETGHVLHSQAGIIKVQIIRTMDTGTIDMMSARHTAAKAVKHLMKAADHCEAAAAEIGLQWKTFMTMYDNLIHPDKSQFEFQRDGRRR